LLDGLLDLSYIESGIVELDLTAMDVMALITEVVGLLRPQIEAKNQQLTVNQAEALPQVQGDAERIRQILINLLSNAHKYTPHGGQIVITAQRLNGWVQIDVRDTGVGLSTDEQAQVFNKFFRAQQPATQEVGGAGLGLAITRLLVELHGGRISVVSAPRQGSTFRFTLPVADPTTT
jgi:two-component system, NarL family, sensor histidine kinase BarA